MLQHTQQADVQKLVPRGPLPAHVAIIMDGNGRWAQERHRPRVWGHKKGVDSVREVVRVAAELGVKVLTLYAFSEENWGRPEDEVSSLMGLLDTYIVKERRELKMQGVSLRTIGDLTRLPLKTQNLLAETVALLRDNSGLILNIALSYGSKNELTMACRQIAELVQKKELDLDAINPELIEGFLWTKGLPPPDLLIRTSGEQRLSNFLLWQMAYSELWFTPVYWPDFRREHFLEAIFSYQNRQRRYGLVEDTRQHVAEHCLM